MFLALDSLPIRSIGRVHGAALGGGSGLAAVCDIVVADEHAVFGFTEVKLGILPAVIAPYAIAKIGAAAARELFLTGVTFPASARARDWPRSHCGAVGAALDSAVERLTWRNYSRRPRAVRTARLLIRRSSGGRLPMHADDDRDHCRTKGVGGRSGGPARVSRKAEASWVSGVDSGRKRSR